MDETKYMSKWATDAQKAYKEGYIKGQIDALKKLREDCAGILEEYIPEIIDGRVEELEDENETLKNDLINSEGNLNHITTEFERLKAKSNEQSRKAGILGYNVTVEFHDDEVSEHSVDCKDIEKYAKQFRNRIISINEKEIKQAKIDILNKLKEEMGDVKVGAWTATQIDELIKEIEEQ